MGTRINTTNRTKLETVIPLSTPYLVFLDPSNICNQQCAFCPTGNRKMIKKIGREQTMMDMDLFARIINQFVGFPQQVKTLRLYKDGEPLMNPNFPDMVDYARRSGFFGSIDTTTNGTLLTPRLGMEIAAAGLNKIHISVPKNYNQTYINNISYFYANSRGACEVFAKIAADYLTEDEKQCFVDIFSPITDSIALEHTAPCWPGYYVDGINKEVGIYGQPIAPDIKVCPYVFYSLTINSNGTVDHCFVDWRCSVLLGDLKTENVTDVWNGEKLREIQFTMLAGLRHTLPNCGVCEHHMYGQPDNIDEYADELIKKI